MPDRSLPTGLVTFLFSDIEGSTRLLQRLGREAYAAVLEDHHRLMRDAVGDTVVSTEGDSFFCAFTTPRAAVEAAVAAQRSLASHPWPPGAEVRVRMGIHTGEGVLGGDDYVGLDVHRAARISAAAHGGQVLVSDQTRTLVAAAPPDGIALDDLGDHRLKDLSAPERLFQLVVEGLRSEFPPLASLDTTPTNLPENLSSFIGREAEVAAIMTAVPAARLLTLVGPGGAGKTRLAIETARGELSRFADGVFLTRLAPLEDASAIASQVAADIGLLEQADRDVAATTIDYLSSRRMLIVLDNCEHLVEGAAEYAQRLLTACPELTILATSREPLLIDGERLHEVGPMDIADGDDPDAALASDAVRLFNERAVHSSHGFDPARWASSVARICSRLDGIPLAIELAAARVGMLSPDEILDRLENRFELLTDRSRRGVRRHGTLEGAIDWSYDLLDADQQRLLRSLGVFRGGFTLDAVAAVCFDEGTSETRVLDLLSDLHDKSLVTRDTTFDRTRFGVLETIREYAARRLHAAGEYEHAAALHEAYYRELARAQARRLGLADQLDALRALEEDHDNLRAVLRRAAAEERYEDAVTVAGYLVWFWYLHSHFTEGERWATMLLEALPDDADGPWLRLLLGAAQYDFRIGDYERARLRLERVLALGTGTPTTEMWTHAYLSTNALYEMDMESAHRQAARAMEMAEDAGNAVAAAYAMFLTVTVETWMAEVGGSLTDKATELLDKLLPVAAGARASSERNIIGHVLQLEGALRAAAGDLNGAVDSLDESVIAFAELGTIGCACHCLETIAEVAARHGHADRAAMLLGATSGLRGLVGIRSAGLEGRSRELATDYCASVLGDDEMERRIDEGSTLGLAEATQTARRLLADLGGAGEPTV